MRACVRALIPHSLLKRCTYNITHPAKRTYIHNEHPTRPPQLPPRLRPARRGRGRRGRARGGEGRWAAPAPVGVVPRGSWPRVSTSVPHPLSVRHQTLTYTPCKHTLEQLARDASSSAAAEGVLRGLWGALGLDEKGGCVRLRMGGCRCVRPSGHSTHSCTEHNTELWRLLGGAESIGRIASASEEQVRPPRDVHARLHSMTAVTDHHTTPCQTAINSTHHYVFINTRSRTHSSCRTAPSTGAPRACSWTSSTAGGPSAVVVAAAAVGGAERW